MPKSESLRLFLCKGKCISFMSGPPFRRCIKRPAFTAVPTYLHPAIRRRRRPHHRGPRTPLGPLRRRSTNRPWGVPWRFRPCHVTGVGLVQPKKPWGAGFVHDKQRDIRREHDGNTAKQEGVLCSLTPDSSLSDKQYVPLSAAEVSWHSVHFMMLHPST